MTAFRYILFLLLTAFSEQLLGQNYTEYFTSEDQVVRYLEENINNLDPVEGKYDAQLSSRSNSPFAQDLNLSATYYITRDPHTKQFTVYCFDQDSYFRGNKYLDIESIGETNAYRVYWNGSSNRAYLENGLRLSTTINLSQKDARIFTCNSSFSFSMVLGFDFVKSYPTVSMYADAKQKASKPTQWSGSGFALTNGYVVTNYHVVEDAASINVQGVNGNFKPNYKARVIATDKVNDLALLKLDGTNPINIPYAVKIGTSEVGEEVFVLGYPLTATMGEEVKLTTGVISSKTGFQGDVSIYQISAPIQPGNSGGPLFDSKGNIIGIVSSKHKGAENVGYAIKTSYLKNLIESSVSANILPQTNKLAGQNLSGKVKMLKNFVYYITCTSGANENISSQTSPTIIGNTTPKNNYQKYIDAAKRGDAEAQYRIGACYQTGDGVEKNISKAAYWWQIGADQNDPTCQMALGLLYLRGTGVCQDIAKAVTLIRKSAEQGMPEAQNYLGMLYRDGIGVTADIKTAVFWWQKAAEQGNVPSMSDLGVCYYNGYGVTKNVELAKQLWEKAAAKGDDMAIKNLESIKYEGQQEGIKPSSQSQNTYQKNIEAAKRGDADAQMMIGICYELGNDGVEKDYDKAASWYKKSADQGNAKGQFALGACYENGLGVPKDSIMALKLWRQSARQGNHMAQYYLGNCYNYGRWVTVDYTHAAMWYQKSAEQGYHAAQFMLGIYYATGKVFQSNMVEAASWWLKAALQGNAKAQFMLGVCYEEGTGVEKDKKQSQYWYRKAAAQGHKEAQSKIK